MSFDIHILVVEDEEEIQRLLRNFLENEGYRVSVAADGVEAVSMFHGGSFDLVLLDLMLPKIDGYSVCEIIRRESEVPIMMLTALDSVENQIKGFDLRIDDYITKPFTMPILMRKIEAVLRRTGKHNKEKKNALYYKELRVDLDAREVYVNDSEVVMTQKEYEILLYLLQNKGRVLTRTMILDAVWGQDYFGDDRIVDTHIKNVRKKLGEECIDTIRGVGYRVAKD